MHKSESFTLGMDVIKSWDTISKKVFFRVLLHWAVLSGRVHIVEYNSVLCSNWKVEDFWWNYSYLLCKFWELFDYFPQNYSLRQIENIVYLRICLPKLMLLLGMN